MPLRRLTSLEVTVYYCTVFVFLIHFCTLLLEVPCNADTRLTQLFQSGKLKDEHNALTTEIADLKQLLNSKQRILQVITLSISMGMTSTPTLLR
jgi:hypothetical protein